LALSNLACNVVVGAASSFLSKKKILFVLIVQPPPFDGRQTPAERYCLVLKFEIVKGKLVAVKGWLSVALNCHSTKAWQIVPKLCFPTEVSPLANEI
jgi:hypothetical protein